MPHVGPVDHTSPCSVVAMCWRMRAISSSPQIVTDAWSTWWTVTPSKSVDQISLGLRMTRFWSSGVMVYRCYERSRCATFSVWLKSPREC